MDIHLKKYDKKLEGTISLTSSKSESNRALLINALSGGRLELHNLAAARDTQTMKRLMADPGLTWDVLDAGTTMRFCTAYLAVKGEGHTITGTPRMCQRPIGLLVDALRSLGASIEYLGNDGYPPLKISKITDQEAKAISIPGNISSQFISALLMIAPSLPQGLQLKLTTEVFSRPYIEMTLSLMKRFGVRHDWSGDTISIEPQTYEGGAYTIEGDWSGASYWYSAVALSQGAEITLGGLREDSLQGDQAVSDIMFKMGVKTEYTVEGAKLSWMPGIEKVVDINFKTCPDLAQTIMVTAALKGVKLTMTGLESLRIKETDRIAAMQNELKKLGADLIEHDGHWEMIPGEVPVKIAPIETYDDHRMAMAFAPVCQVRDVTIQEKDVVAKSYPGFWEDFAAMGMVAI